LRLSWCIIEIIKYKYGCFNHKYSGQGSSQFHRDFIITALDRLICSLGKFQRYREIKYIWAVIFTAVFIWSGINPKDQFTWLLEVAPALIGGVLLIATYNSFRLTSILYFFVLVHCIVLMIGGHYTYAEVPLFDGLWGSERNNYDKVGHFFQGFVPALLAREILIRKKVVNGNVWLAYIVISICLAFSAFYELIEWWVALASGETAEAFLGTQGYIWDTQSDMGIALLGAMCSLLLLSRVHDSQIEKVNSRRGAYENSVIFEDEQKS
jgi:putative membrane protein